MKLFILSIILISSINIAKSQLSGQAKIDSLLKELPNAKEDTNHVKLLISISYYYKGNNPEKNLKYSNEALELATKLNWEIGIANAFNEIAIYYAIKNDYTSALEYWEKALIINNKIDNKLGIALNLGNIGNIYQNQSEYNKALDYYTEEISILNKLNKKEMIGNYYSRMGIIYYELSDFPKALEYHLKALKISEEFNNKSKMSYNLNAIGAVHSQQSNYKEAMDYYKKALQIGKELNDKDGIATTLGNIGGLYNFLSDYNNAIKFIKESLEIHKELGNGLGKAIGYANIATSFKEQGNYNAALEYFEKSIKTSKNIKSKYGLSINYGNLGEMYLDLAKDTVSTFKDTGSNVQAIDKEININNSIQYLLDANQIAQEIGELKNRIEILENLADAYAVKGDYKSHYKYIHEHIRIKDSVYNQENQKKIEVLTSQREKDIKQAEIEKQKLLIAEQEKREQIIINVAIGGFIIMVIVIIIITRLLRRSDKLLHNVLPKTIADRLKKKEHPISDHFDQASIIFIDIIGFTSMSKDADPSRIVEALNKMFTIYDGIAHKYGMEKIKTIGDSYMAAAGIPIVQKDNAHRAAQMALEVKKVMEDYHTADGTKINVRIGVDCGPVVAGVIGEHKFIYDLWSDAVNTASRMESTGEAGHIQTTQRFKDAVSEYQEYEYQERGEVMIKGIGTMKTYFLES